MDYIDFLCYVSLESACGPSGLYLEILRSGKYNVGRQTKTWPNEAKNEEEDSDDDIEVLEDEEEEVDEEVEAEKMMEEQQKIIIEKHQPCVSRAKLLQFHDNQRPAYWGTWTKKQNVVTGRRPLGR